MLAIPYFKNQESITLIGIALFNELVDVVESEIKKLYGNDIGEIRVKAIWKTIEQFTVGITSSR